MTLLPSERVFQFSLHSRSFPLHADWRKSDSSVDREPKGNWRWKSNSKDVIASSHSFSNPAARAPRRACTQATVTLLKKVSTMVLYKKPHILSKYLGVSFTTPTFIAVGFYLKQYIKHEST